MLVASLLVGIYQAQDNQLRNLRIVRENPGGRDDRLVARWNLPGAGQDQVYWYRVRRRRAGSDNWGNWSELSTTYGTSVTLFHPSGIPEDEAIDIQIQVDANNPPGPTAAAYNVWEQPPAPRRKGPWPTATPKPPAKTCESLSNSDSGIVVSSTYGLASGIQCQQIGAAGIGIPGIIEGGFIDAVDIWGNVRQAQVCFLRDSGAFVFLDAFITPRTVTAIEGYLDMGKICVDIDKPGSVVLVPSTDPVAAKPQAEATQAQVPQAIAPQSESHALSNCWVWTKYILNLRAAPVNGEVLTHVPYDVGLSVVGRSGSWYQVNWQGATGWIASNLVRTAGNCG